MNGSLDYHQFRVTMSTVNFCILKIQCYILLLSKGGECGLRAMILREASKYLSGVFCRVDLGGGTLAVGDVDVPADFWSCP